MLPRRAGARRMIDEVEPTWADLARQRVEFATKAAAAMEKLKKVVASAPKPSG